MGFLFNFSPGCQWWTRGRTNALYSWKAKTSQPTKPGKYLPNISLFLPIENTIDLGISVKSLGLLNCSFPGMWIVIKLVELLCFYKLHRLSFWKNMSQSTETHQIYVQSTFWDSIWFYSVNICLKYSQYSRIFYSTTKELSHLHLE